MSWRSPARSPSPRAWRLGCVLALVAAVGILPAAAATVYKWTDADGKVYYGDKPPKGFKGEVTRVEIDPAATATAPRPPPPQPAPPVTVEPVAAPTPAPDLLTQRRALRAKLEANLAAARERLDLAKKALAEVSDTQPGEQQYTQRQVDPASVNPNAVGAAGTAAPAASANPDPTQTTPTKGGAFGMAPRSNCRTAVGANGKSVLVCPTLVPGEAYYERVATLEAAVKHAEEDVEEAERAYRRGVD